VLVLVLSEAVLVIETVEKPITSTITSTISSASSVTRN